MNQNRNTRVKYLLWIFFPTIAAFVVQNVISLIEMQVIAFYEMFNYKGGGIIGLDENIIDKLLSETSMLIIYLAYSIICIVLFAYFYIKKFRDSKKRFFENVSSNWLYTIVGVVLFALSAQYVCTYIMNALAQAFPSWLEEYEMIMDSSGFSNEMSIGLIIYTVVLGPICEELAFRGITFKAARQVMSVPMAIFSQALLFGGFHMNMLQSSYAFLLGLALGYIMYCYDNIFIVIAIHMIFNAFSLVAGEFLMSDYYTIISYFCWLLGSLIVAYCGLLLLKNGAPAVKEESTSADI
ncbi:MAG: CPBP family intramembrane metalloprotease [Pseudobutyrivibrio sp.]|nr:CPBP family intramembrane metalloprotease [Pseudobutyrivibrio sp.]